MLTILEYFFEKLGYMVYHYWRTWITLIIAFILFRILAYFADRFVYYSPPVSYRFRLICFTYTFTEWPGALLSGVMLMYQWRLNIFDNSFADDRFTAMLLATVMGCVAAYFSPKIRQRYKPYLFLGLGIFSALFALEMHEKGWLHYNYWNNYWTIVRYVSPYLLVYLYDDWESADNNRVKDKLPN